MGMDFGGPPLIFQAMFVIIPAIVVLGIGYAVISGIMNWSRNNASPVLSREAKVVAKRTRVSGGAGDTSASTSYYVTFEFKDRSRIELPMRGSTYGMLAEGDRGMLTSQGTRFTDFQPLL